MCMLILRCLKGDSGGLEAATCCPQYTSHQPCCIMGVSQSGRALVSWEMHTTVSQPLSNRHGVIINDGVCVSNGLIVLSKSMHPNNKMRPTYSKDVHLILDKNNAKK